jgi:hypothetical protein
VIRLSRQKSDFGAPFDPERKPVFDQGNGMEKNE